MQPTVEQLCRRQQDKTSSMLIATTNNNSRCCCDSPIEVCSQHDILNEEQRMFVLKYNENETRNLRSRPAVQGCIDPNGTCCCYFHDPFGLNTQQTQFCPKHDIFDANALAELSI